MIARGLAVAVLLAALSCGPAVAGDGTASGPEAVFEINTAQFQPVEPASLRGAEADGFDPLIVKLQVLLDRVHISPGVIDGHDGDNVAKALAAFERRQGLQTGGGLTLESWLALVDAAGTADPMAPYTIQAADVAGPFVAEIPTDYAEMAKLERLDYRGPAELLAERFHMDIDLLRDLNPGVDFELAGTEIVVAQVGAAASAPVIRIEVDKAKGLLRGFDADGSLVAAYPATIGTVAMPSLVGSHTVRAVVPDASYWYRPDVNFQQGDNDEALEIAPGPNNPIGSVWIDLSAPTFGIHGTPDPEQIAKRLSHGCIRLTNWDVEELAGLVETGAAVVFLE